MSKGRAGANSRLQKQAEVKEDRRQKKEETEWVDETRTGSEETKQAEGGLFSKRYASGPFAVPFLIFFSPHAGVPEEWYVYTGGRLAARV